MTEKCQSCGMPIESGIYCEHCVDENGNLQDFATRFDRMVQWQERRGTARVKAETETISYMATLTAWAEHPEVIARLKVN